MALYKYTQLSRKDEEIRLLELMPGKREDDISLRILHTPLVIHPKEKNEIKRLSLEELQKTLPQNMYAMENLDGRYLFKHRDGQPNTWDHPDPELDPALYKLPAHRIFRANRTNYDALSYIWGSTENPVTVKVCGKSHSSMEIGASLAIALKQLRYKNKPRTMWVDSVCINQHDIPERNHEIERMRNIFSLSDRTIIWLGEEADDSTIALATVEYLAQQVEFIGGGLVAHAPGTKLMDWRHSNYKFPYDTRTWSSLRALFQRPWFNRVWVLQEALLGDQGSVIQCGNTCISFCALRKAMLVLGRKVTTPSDIRSKLLSYTPGILPTSMRALPELLRWAKHRSCSDPRDKIYGIIGLVPTSIIDGIRRDYSAPISKIYQSTILSYINVTKQLCLLQHCRLDQSFEDAPSWVPNWSFSDDNAMTGVDLGRCPSGRSSAEVRYHGENDLEIMGMYCTKVQSVKIKSAGDAKEAFRAIRRWEPEGSLSGNYVGGGSMIDAFLETIYQGHTKERYPGVRVPYIDDLRQSYLDAIVKDTRNEEAVLEYVYGLGFGPMAFIMTEDGYMGIGPLGVEPGK